MSDETLPGDVNPGDVIVLPGMDEALQVVRVRLGQGGFILTVVSVDEAGSATEQTVTLTTCTKLRTGRSAANRAAS